MLRVSAFLLVLFVTAGSAQLSAQQTANRRPGPFLIYGPVHTIRDEQATFKKNENGAIVEGPKVLVQVWQYNEDGTKQDQTYYSPDGKFTRRTVDTYAPDGRILETDLFVAGTLSIRIVSNYDDQKRLIDQVTYRRDGSTQKRVLFRRQGNNDESETWSYDTRGQIISQSKTINDLPAKRSDSISISPGGVVQTQSSIVDNPDGSREFTTERSTGSFKRQVITTVNGIETRVIHNKDGTINSRVRFIQEFDSYQNMTKTTHLTAAGDSLDFVPISVTYRTITYFGKD